MKQTQPQFTPPTPPRRTKKWSTITVITLAVIVSCGGVGLGVYNWQQNAADKKEHALLTEISTLKNNRQKDTRADDQTKAEERTLTKYTSKTGGLTIELPSQYVVIVNVDGNKGGAPGSTLRIGETVSPGIVNDNIYEWVEIEIDHLNSTIDQEATIISDRLKQDRFENIDIADITFKNIPAKLITGNGTGYDAGRRIYIVKSGEFVYRFTSKTDDASKDDEMFKAVLEGSSIEEKTLNP